MSTTTGIILESQIATKTMLFPRPPVIYPKPRIRLILSILLVLSISIIFYNYLITTLTTPNNKLQPNDRTLTPVPSPPTRQQNSIRIAKATILYPRSPSLYTDALALHSAHNARFGYDMHVLRVSIIKGAMNKLLWLQQLIIAELQKPEEGRVEWILYFDPGVVLWNERIPLHTYLPPVGELEAFKTLEMVGMKEDGGRLSTSVFFVRVSGGSVRLLTLAMARILDAEDGDDSGVDVVGSALQSVLEREKHREKVVYQSRLWYDKQGPLTGESGLFLLPDWNQSHSLYLDNIKYGLGIVKSAAERPDMSKHRTAFPRIEGVQSFWNAVIEARRVLGEAKDRGHTIEIGEWKDVVREVKDCVDLRAWDTEGLIRGIEMLKEGLGIE